MLKLADQNTTLSGSAEGVANPAPRRWPSAIFFLLCLGVAALLAALDADVRLTVLRAASRVQTAEKPSAELQVGQHTTILHAPAIDARWWVIHAEAALRQGAWRIRDTKLDNAPEGREVHWSSGPIWTLRAIAAGIAAFTGQPILQTIPEAALWFGPVTFALGAVLLSILMGMTFGWRPAGLLILVLATALPVCGNFRVGEPDHHGVVLFFLLGSVLCIAAGGAGAVMLGARQRTRRYFALAGLLGAAAMWVSAATTISVLAGCGLGALVAAALLRKRHGSGVTLDPALWKIWARWGAAGCLVFYLLEYFPFHLGWRLEVNHPLYALAWLGAGEVLCVACAFLGGAELSRRFLARGLIGLSLVALPVLLIVLASPSVFWVADPFLLALHKNHIREFGPLLETIASRRDALDWLDYFAWMLFAAVGFGTLLWSKVSAPWPSVLAFAFAPAATVQILGFAQIRWASLAVGLWSVCAVLVVAGYLQGASRRRIPLLVPVVLAFLGVCALLSFPQLVVRRFIERDKIAANLPQSLVPVILLRDVAHRLVEASPSRKLLVLSDPTSSTELAYFGGLGVFGTLYWENLRGLEKSAWLFTAPDETTARERFRTAGVTHLVLPSWDDFTSATFLTLLQKSGRAPVAQKTSYLDTVVQGAECPQWLRPHYYPIPATFGLSNEWIRVFEVCFDQSVFDSFLYRGVYHVEAGDFPAAQRMLAKAQEADPANPDVARWLAAVSREAQKTKLPQQSKVP